MNFVLQYAAGVLEDLEHAYDYYASQAHPSHGYPNFSVALKTLLTTFGKTLYFRHKIRPLW